MQAKQSEASAPSCSPDSVWDKEKRAFELHCHSTYSKGRRVTWEGLATPREMVRAAKANGLGGIALTDHNTIGGLKEASEEAKAQGIIFIPGIEVSTQTGHIIALGISEHIREKQTLDATLDEIKSQGGISIAAHPFDIYNNGVKHAMSKTDAVEVFNSLSLDRLSNSFCKKQAEKLGLSTVSGSDAHAPSMIGLARNIIEADDLDSALKAIKAGKVELDVNYSSISGLLEWTRERFVRSYNDVLTQTYDYWRPKGIVARMLLNHFINNSKGKFWASMGGLGLGVSAVYSGLKILTY